jgi:hypothetical protein
MNFLRKKIVFIPLIILVLAILLRIVAPVLILEQINAKLHDASPTIDAKINDLDLSLLLGSVRLENLEAKTKEADQTILKIEEIETFLDLNAFFRGKLEFRVSLEKVDFTYSNDLMNALKKHTELAPPKEEKPLPNIRVSRVDVKNSVIRLAPFPELTGDKNIIMKDINVRITNVVPNEEIPETMFTIQGTLLSTGKVKTNGVALLNDKPLVWTVDTEILGFDLTELNPFLKENVPLTFTRGEMDFFMEAKASDNRVTGYLKPFIKDLDVIKKKEKFVNTKHWIVEIISGLGNVVMQNDKVAATRVPFVFDGQMKTETGESIGKAFQHAFVEKISRGIENSIDL